MLDDPVIRSAFTVIGTVFFGTVTAITVLYLLIRSGEKGKPRPPHKNQLWMAGIIAIAVPLLVLVYALFFSPAAQLSPQQLHQKERQMQQASEQRP